VEAVVNALTVLALILLALRLVAVVLQVLVPRSTDARNRQPVFDPCLEPYVLRTSAPPSSEGKLVSKLSTGAIDRPRYQREMAGLAAADVRAHPLVVPPDDRSSP
jgi:hypothetical protein